MTEWVEDRGLQMKPGDAKVRINMYPGIHEVETPVDFKLSKAMVQGVPTGEW